MHQPQAQLSLNHNSNWVNYRAINLISKTNTLTRTINKKGKILVPRSWERAEIGAERIVRAKDAGVREESGIIWRRVVMQLIKHICTIYNYDDTHKCVEEIEEFEDES